VSLRRRFRIPTATGSKCRAGDHDRLTHCPSGASIALVEKLASPPGCNTGVPCNPDYGWTVSRHALVIVIAYRDEADAVAIARF